MKHQDFQAQDRDRRELVSRSLPAQVGAPWSGKVLRVWQAAIDARSRSYHPKLS